MAVWPASLPQTVFADGYKEEFPMNALRTQMDAGPPKMRRRYTAAFRPFTGTEIFTTAQVATLDTFFVTTLQGGALAFDWSHPRTGAAASVRFTKPPVVTSLGGGVYRVE